MIGVADAFSAMTSDRPYRGRMSLEAACEELERNAGSQFDSRVVGLFVEEVRRNPLADDEDDELAKLDDLDLGARKDGFGVLGSARSRSPITSRFCTAIATFTSALRPKLSSAQVQDTAFAVCLFELEDSTESMPSRVTPPATKRSRILRGLVEQVAVKSGGTAARFSGRRIGLLATARNEAVGPQPDQRGRRQAR